MIGPNVRKLICAKMAKDAIPPGGGVQAGVDFLMDKDKVIETARNAQTWVAHAILAIRQAPDPNPYKSKTDEEVAQVILDRVAAKYPDRKWPRS